MDKSPQIHRVTWIVVQNIHEHVENPDGVQSITLVSGDYDYCHYLYDGTDDRGWGCGYRTLQTIISWMIHNNEASKHLTIPSLKKIQEILVQVLSEII